MFKYFWMVLVAIIVVVFVGYTIWTIVDAVKTYIEYRDVSVDSLADVLSDYILVDHPYLTGIWFLAIVALGIVSFMIWYE